MILSFLRLLKRWPVDLKNSTIYSAVTVTPLGNAVIENLAGLQVNAISSIVFLTVSFGFTTWHLFPPFFIYVMFCCLDFTILQFILDTVDTILTLANILQNTPAACNFILLFLLGKLWRYPNWTFFISRSSVRIRLIDVWSTCTNSSSSHIDILGSFSVKSSTSLINPGQMS